MRKKICLVVANFYPSISHNLISGASKIIKNNGHKINKIFKVPGVLEIPYVISKNINKYDGFIALGCVIKGETPHFEFISKSTIDAIIRLSIIYKKPIGNGIITCLNKKQAIQRSSIKRNKGKESAKAMLSLFKI
tara:strand:+ start:407 stop:811 length:405 start_codon:yes stop_codon:yes gene_type:complete